MKKTISPLLTYKPGIVWFIILQLTITNARLNAQASAGAAKETIYLLPDGRILSPGKWDSLEQAWGKGRIQLLHNKDDDAKGIVHLERQTDEMKQLQEEEIERGKHQLDSMLNKPAPVFNLADINGKHWNLKALRGKIIVLNFWFTSCAPCIREMPELNKQVEDYNQGNVVFLALTFNSASQVKAFLQTHAFNYTLLPGSQQVDEQYKITTWPASIVIGKKGNIKKIIQSSQAIRDDLSAAIDAESKL